MMNNLITYKSIAALGAESVEILARIGGML